jgi:hypothetical protein
MTFNILSFTREQAIAYGQQGGLNIKSALHWDVCNDLKNGIDRIEITKKHNIGLDAIVKIKRCKCPDV